MASLERESESFEKTAYDPYPATEGGAKRHNQKRYRKTCADPLCKIEFRASTPRQMFHSDACRQRVGKLRRAEREAARQVREAEALRQKQYDERRQAEEQAVLLEQARERRRQAELAKRLELKLGHPVKPRPEVKLADKHTPSAWQLERQQEYDDEDGWPLVIYPLEDTHAGASQQAIGSSADDHGWLLWIDENKRIRMSPRHGLQGWQRYWSQFMYEKTDDPEEMNGKSRPAELPKLRIKAKKGVYA